MGSRRPSLRRTSSSVVVTSECLSHGHTPKSPEVRKPTMASLVKSPISFLRKKLTEKSFAFANHKSTRVKRIELKDGDFRTVKRNDAKIGDCKIQVGLSCAYDEGCNFNTASVHMENIFGTFSANKTEDLSGSCPNLLGVNRVSKPNIFITDNRSTSNLQVKESKKKPDLAVKIDDSISLITKIYSASTPKLNDVFCFEEIWENIPAHGSRDRRSSGSGIYTDSVTSEKLYRGTHISQLMPHLFIGSVEAAYDEPLLCRLGIDSVVDITNSLPWEIPDEKKLDCPCNCVSSVKHLRSKLYVSVPDDCTSRMTEFYGEINAFIDGVRKCGKKVLVFSYTGRRRACLAVIQYLMVQHNLLLRQAGNLIREKWTSCTCTLSSEEWFSLELLERRLYPTGMGRAPDAPGMAKTVW